MCTIGCGFDRGEVGGAVGGAITLLECTIWKVEFADMASSSVSGAWAPSPSVAFRGILVARLMSVFFMHISDCDETFNYWEPVSI